jgi:hypothetical protein
MNRSYDVCGIINGDFLVVSEDLYENNSFSSCLTNIDIDSMISFPGFQLCNGKVMFSSFGLSLKSLSVIIRKIVNSFYLIVKKGENEFESRAEINFSDIDSTEFKEENLPNFSFIENQLLSSSLFDLLVISSDVSPVPRRIIPKIILDSKQNNFLDLYNLFYGITYIPSYTEVYECLLLVLYKFFKNKFLLLNNSTGNNNQGQPSYFLRVDVFSNNFFSISAVETSLFTLFDDIYNSGCDFSSINNNQNSIIRRKIIRNLVVREHKENEFPVSQIECIYFFSDLFISSLKEKLLEEKTITHSFSNFVPLIDVDYIFSKLNKSQKEVIYTSLSTFLNNSSNFQSFNSTPILSVIGLPGVGKSHTLSILIVFLVALNKKVYFLYLIFSFFIYFLN